MTERRPRRLGRFTLRQRLTLSLAVLLAAVATVGLVGLASLRAQTGVLAEAEATYSSQLRPQIALAHLLQEMQEVLPDAERARPAARSAQTRWASVRDGIDEQFAAVATNELPTGAMVQRARRAEVAWTRARSAGDELLTGAATTDELRRYDRASRQLRGEVALLLAALQPVVAEPLVATQDELRATARWLALASLGIGLGALVVAVALGRSILRPVHELRTVAQRLGEGELSARAQPSYGELAELAEVLNVMAERLAIERAALKERASRDGLTGVLNAHEIKERLAVEVSRADRYGTPVSILMVDLDHFKRVNDEHGHLAGDSALVSFARSVEPQLRPSDLFGRYGGEEFLVVLPETDTVGARAVAERIRAIIDETPIPLPAGGHFRLTASIGAAVARGDGAAPEEVIAIADAALYAAKRGGRNRAVMAGDAPPSGVGAGELGPSELGVEAVAGEQLGVGAALDDAAAVEHEDHVGVDDR